MDEILLMVVYDERIRKENGVYSQEESDPI
jgi:hypothetical protein